MDHLYLKDGRLRVWETFRHITPHELFGYWTEPAKLQLWWPEEATTEPAPGGRYRYAFPGPGHTLTGTFSEVIPGERLAFSWRWEHEPGVPERHVVVDFEPRDENTLLTVTHGFYGAGEAEEREGQLEGWQHFLGRLERLVRETNRKNAR